MIKPEWIIEGALMTALAVALCITTAKMGAAWGLLWIGGYWLMQAREMIINESKKK